MPKTRHFDETLHPTHTIPSVAAIVPAEVPSFKKTILGLRQDNTETNNHIIEVREGVDRPTKSTIQRHYTFHPTGHQYSSIIRQDNDMEDSNEDDIRWYGDHKRNVNKHLTDTKSVGVERKEENGARRFLLEISPETVSIIPKSRHSHSVHVTGGNRHKIHKHKIKNRNGMDLAGTLVGSNIYGGAFDAIDKMKPASVLQQGNPINSGNIALASLPLINSKVNALYRQQLHSNRKPTLDFTTQNNALVKDLPASPEKLTPNSLTLLGSGSKRWERNRFNRKKERYHHNETEEYHHDHHHFGKMK